MPKQVKVGVVRKEESASVDAESDPQSQGYVVACKAEPQ